MDAILQLFSGEEILDRLGEKKLTGCFHAFTLKEAANLMVRDGLVISAVKAQVEGTVEGEGVLNEILDWKDARFLWQPNTTAPIATTRPLQIEIREFLAKRKSGGTTLLEKGRPAALPASRPATTTPAVISIPSRGKSTGPLEGVPTSNTIDNTATKTLTFTAEDRTTRDETLLRKHPLALVPETDPTGAVTITRVNSLIGRSPACEIPIADPSISRQHCLLQLTDRGLLVKDMGTTNGTKVNGISLKEGYINVGDKLTVGNIVYVLKKA